MVAATLDAQLLLVHQITPALVLDRSGTIIATNNGIARLSCASHQKKSCDAVDVLNGNHISDVGFVPLPNSLSSLRTWNALLVAAFSLATSTIDNEECSSNSAEDTRSSNDEFWENEVRDQACIESNIGITRHLSNLGDSDMRAMPSSYGTIAARVAIRWFSTDGDGLFLVCFTRASLPQYTTPEPLGLGAATTDHSESHTGAQSINLDSLNDDEIDTVSGRFGSEAETNVSDSADIALAFIPHIVAIFDTDGQAINFSKSWYLFSGLDTACSLGAGWISIIHPEDVADMIKAWAHVIQHESSHWTHQARYRRTTDETYCWFLIRAEPYRDTAGTVVRWYASMMDIHEWVVARLKADLRRQSIITLFAQTDVMLWGIDKANQIYICEGRLKWDPTRVVKLLEDALRAQTANTVEGGENQGQDTDRHLVHTIQGVLQGGTFSPIVEHWEDDRYFRTRFVAEHVPQGLDEGTTSANVVQAALALTFDITEEKARSVLLTENKRLVAKEKAALDASNLKSRFLANMSHEIRTPISGIIGLSEHLSDCGLTEEQLEFSESIQETAKFLLTLVNDVLDFSKMESGHMDVESLPFSPHKLVSDTLIPLRLQANERGLALNFWCDLQPDALFLGDPWRLRQILTNLIGNSLKFTPTGRIDLSVEKADQKDNEVFVKFVVSDTGVGITEEAMKPLFKPFSQADGSTARLYGGTGLGLAICRQLVELMSGTITLRSETGRGTTATCRIPFQAYRGPTQDLLISTTLPTRARPSVLDKRQISDSYFQAKSSDGTSVGSDASSTIANTLQLSMHILLVEDNPINRKVISLALKKLGYAVTTACDGQEALDYLCKQSNQRRPNAVLMDCMMPVVDGYEATRRIRNDHDMFDELVRQLPIIALTASAVKGDRERCRDAGMDDYLTKPAARDELKRTLARWLVAPRIRGLTRSQSVE